MYLFIYQLAPITGDENIRKIKNKNKNKIQNTKYKFRI